MENNNKKLSTKLISIIQEQITKFFDKQKTLVRRDRAVVIEPSADNFTALVEIGTGEESTQHELKNKTGTSLQQGDLVSVETAGKIISYNDSVIAISENGVGGVGSSGGAKVTNNYLTAINQSAVTLTSEYKTVAELSFEASTTTNALIPVIIQPDSNVQVSSRLRLGLTTISERQYVNGYTEILPNLSATQQTLYLDCKSDTAAVLPTGKTSIGLVAENVNLWVDTTIVTCEYYFESDGTYNLYLSASAAWIDYGDGSAQGTSKSHYYTAGTYIVKFKSLYHAYGYPLFSSNNLRRIISGRLSQSSSPWGVFQSCTALLSVNEDFFHDLSSVDLNFGSAFIYCSALTSIPAKILAPIANRCKYLNNIFRGCSALTSIPASLFDGVPNTSGVDFSSAFTYCSAVTSAVPELWVTHSNATHSYTFMGCTNAANYAAIPSTWR